MLKIFGTIGPSCFEEETILKMFEMNRDGRLKRGQKIVLAGFGAGLTWGATIIEW